MSTFYVDELSSNPLDTTIRVTNKILLKYVRPHIYIKGPLNPCELSLTVLDGSDVLNEYTLTHDQLNNISTLDNIHGFVRFDTELVLHHTSTNDFTPYTLRLKMNNYTEVPGIVIGLVTTLDDPTTELYDSNSEYMRGFEIFKYNIF